MIAWKPKLKNWEFRSKKRAKQKTKNGKENISYFWHGYSSPSLELSPSYNSVKSEGKKHNLRKPDHCHKSLKPHTNVVFLIFILNGVILFVQTFYPITKYSFILDLLYYLVYFCVVLCSIKWLRGDLKVQRRKRDHSKSGFLTIFFTKITTQEKPKVLDKLSNSKTFLFSTFFIAVGNLGD